jgi:hypothetical protein
MLTLILVTKLVCEIALLSLLGRAALALLVGVTPAKIKWSLSLGVARCQS